MAVLIRAITYASLFIGLVLVFLPTQLISWSGVSEPQRMGVLQAAGTVVGAIGAGVILWCVLSFVMLGKGTPAPFDPPRRLVVRGPYKFVRNPMYIGAVLALAGAAFFYESPALACYAALFFVLTHAFVVWYEEPSLRSTFGAEYERYCKLTRRWWPKP